MLGPSEMKARGAGEGRRWAWVRGEVEGVWEGEGWARMEVLVC